MGESNAAANFWSWFIENSERFSFFEDVEPSVREGWFNEVLQKLHQFCESLYFEFGSHPDDNICELIVTAEGNKEFFAHVRELVDAAPVINGWVIVAFKQPKGTDFALVCEGIEFSPKDTWFLPLSSKEKPELVGIRVGYQDFEKEQQESYLWGAYLMIDTILGEEVSVRDIHHVEVGALPTVPSEEGYIPFVELEEFVRKSNQG